MAQTTNYVALTAVTVAVGLAAYAVYFDYKRRNDVEFRKKLRKEKKRVQKTVQESKEDLGGPGASDISPAALREALLQVKNEPTPQTPDEKEHYFMSQVSAGEQLAVQGPQFALLAALHFFRALRVYPSPVELIVIYQKTIPENVFKLVMELSSLEVQARVEGYYNVFPPKKTNVSIASREPIPGQGARNVVILNKDIAAGEVIYKEQPVVAVLDSDLIGKGAYCDHCLCVLDQENATQYPDSSPSSFPSTFCSVACQQAAKTQYQNLLFSSESPLPEQLSAALPPTMEEARRKAQAEFAEYVRKEGKAGPLLVARFIARQVAVEVQKMGSGSGLSRPKVVSDFTDADTGEEDGYGLADHIERLRFLEVQPNVTESVALAGVLNAALPGLEEFVTQERLATLSGKMMYNAFGVSYGSGRDDKPEPTQRPEDMEVTRTPLGTERQVGSAFYTLSSYLIHSCDPTARVGFTGGNTELSLIATRDLKKGEVLSIAFVNVEQQEGESVIDCRRRRRKALARGWRFACGCNRCLTEAKAMTSEEKGSDEGLKDESKLETPNARYEEVKAASEAVQNEVDE